MYKGEHVTMTPYRAGKEHCSKKLTLLTSEGKETLILMAKQALHLGGAEVNV